MKYVIPLVLILSACTENAPKMSDAEYWNVINNSRVITHCPDATTIREYNNELIYIHHYVIKKVTNKDKPCEGIKK